MCNPIAARVHSALPDQSLSLSEIEPCSQPRLTVLTTLYSHSSLERITDRGLQPNCLKTLPLPAFQGFDFLAISTDVIHSCGRR